MLPLAVSPALRVALIGPNAGCESDAPGLNSCDAINAQLGGYTAYGARVVTLRAAVEAAAAAGGFTVSYARGCNIDDGNLTMIPGAVAAAAAADVAIVVLGDSSDGYGHGSCAEGIDADQLDLVGGQLALLDALVTQVRAIYRGCRWQPSTVPLPRCRQMGQAPLPALSVLGPGNPHRPRRHIRPPVHARRRPLCLHGAQQCHRREPRGDPAG